MVGSYWRFGGTLHMKYWPLFPPRFCFHERLRRVSTRVAVWKQLRLNQSYPKKRRKNWRAVISRRKGSLLPCPSCSFNPPLYLCSFRPPETSLLRITYSLHSSPCSYWFAYGPVPYPSTSYHIFRRSSQREQVPPKRRYLPTRLHMALVRLLYAQTKTRRRLLSCGM